MGFISSEPRSQLSNFVKAFYGRPRGEPFFQGKEQDLKQYAYPMQPKRQQTTRLAGLLMLSCTAYVASTLLRAMPLLPFQYAEDPMGPGLPSRSIEDVQRAMGMGFGPAHWPDVGFGLGRKTRCRLEERNTTKSGICLREGCVWARAGYVLSFKVDP